MARTTSELVGGIVEVADGVDLAPFILSANELVTELCTGSNYSDDRLELIERWLAAHFYAVFDPRTKLEQAAGLMEQFEGRADMGLRFTRYGQQAMMLDTAGNLAAVNNSLNTVKKVLPAAGRSPGVGWVGRAPSGYPEVE